MANNHIERNTVRKKILNTQRYGFQHVYLEYYAFVRDLNEQQIYQLLHDGLVSNLNTAKFNSEALQTLKPEIISVSKDIFIQKQQLEKDIEQFYSTHSVGIKQDINALHLHNLLKEDLKKEQVTHLDTLKEKLTQQLEEEFSNPWLEFDLAWIYFHIYNDMQKAEHHFTRAAESIVLKEGVLTTISLRYLAYTKLMLNKQSEALSVMESVTSQYSTTKPQQLFESVQLDKSFEPHKQIKILKRAIEESPLYYIQLQSDALLGKHPSIQTLLSAFHAAKLTQIQEIAQYKWKNSSIYRHERLPSDFDKQAFFNDTFQQFKILLIHQSYPLLCKTEVISEKILISLSAKARNELSIAKTKYTKKIIHINSKWKFINLLGAGLIYIAAIISLASIFLFLTSFLLGITIPLPIAEWRYFLPIFFGSIIAVGLLGILLIQFTPTASKILSQKKEAITDALSPRLHTEN